MQDLEKENPQAVSFLIRDIFKKTNMINKILPDFDKSHFLKEMEIGMRLIPQAVEAGQAISAEKIQQLLLVGCGAPHYMFQSLAFWANWKAIDLQVQVLYPHEFLQIANDLDHKTAVIFGSHSGKTAETVSAAKAISNQAIRSIAITQFHESPLALAANEIFSYGPSEQGYFSSFAIAQAIVSAFLDKADAGWKSHAQIISSLSNFPSALADAKKAGMKTALENAENLRDKKEIYLVGSGPMYTTAYVYAACFLMEMQWIHALSIRAADFFHGPFEALDDTTPVIVLLGESPDRKEAQRVLKFCEKYIGGAMAYDSKQFEMPGIHPSVRAIFAPFILDAAMTTLVEQLARLRNHPLETRRYMGRVDY